VEIKKPEPTLLELMQAVSGNLFGPLTRGGIVTVFVVFMLVQREDLRDRFVRLLGSSQLNVTTQALDDAAQRVSRYLFMQLVVNASYGIPIGIGLYFIGIPNACCGASSHPASIHSLCQPNHRIHSAGWPVLAVDQDGQSRPHYPALCGGRTAEQQPC
jgi:hypothetical protein